MGKYFVLGVVVIVALVGGFFGYRYYQQQQQVSRIASFDECAKAGFPIMESYPARCSTGDGRTFKQVVEQNQQPYSDEIVVTTPQPNQVVASPLHITGKARGPWFFEAQFSAELFDANNKSLGVGILTAHGEWMTEEFVPFSGDIEFGAPTTKTGILKIQNANPSGLPENQKELTIPVMFN